MPHNLNCHLGRSGIKDREIPLVSLASMRNILPSSHKCHSLVISVSGHTTPGAYCSLSSSGYGVSKIFDAVLECDMQSISTCSFNRSERPFWNPVLGLVNCGKYRSIGMPYPFGLQCSISSSIRRSLTMLFIPHYSSVTLKTRVKWRLPVGVVLRWSQMNLALLPRTGRKAHCPISSWRLLSLREMTKPFHRR